MRYLTLCRPLNKTALSYNDENIQLVSTKWANLTRRFDLLSEFDIFCHFIVIDVAKVIKQFSLLSIILVIQTSHIRPVRTSKVTGILEVSVMEGRAIYPVS